MDKKEILNEELKRFNQILEYTFYIGTEGDEPEGDVENLLFDTDISEQEEEVVDVEEPAEDPFGGAEPAAEVPAEDPMAEPAAEVPAEDPMAEPAEDPFGGGAPVEDEFVEDPAMEEPMDDMGMEEPAGDEVEVDVTELVDKTEEAKTATGEVSSKVDDLLSKFSELESLSGTMDNIISKMDSLEQEMIDRNPTPTEKLNMISTKSFPYTQKLSDFWDEREGYEIGGEDEEKEFILTQDEIEADYSEVDVKNSFNPKKEE
jgi:hypothetical protein